jgi:ATP-dependent protease HslVU (ClpYQ) peptidase subunit
MLTLLRKSMWVMIQFLTLMLSYPLLSSSHSFPHGTAVFVIRTPNEIVVAADSRSVSGNDIPDPEPICKIRRFGDVYIVVNGMSQDTPTGYEVFSILKAASERKGMLTDKISAFESMVKAPLEKALNRLRRENAVAFQRNAIEIAPLGVNFFGVERGVLALYNRRFVVRLSANNQASVFIERHGCSGADCPDGVAVVTVGATEFKERFARENPNFMQGNLVEAARKFVQMQIDARVVDVGPPIDILRITKDGAKWIQKKPEC